MIVAGLVNQNRISAICKVIPVKQVKDKWSAFMENVVLFRKINGWLTVVWTIMIPVSIATGWISSVPFISAISLYALITGHLSTWQAARVEVKQEDEAEKKDDDFEDRIEKKVDEIKAE